MGRRKKAMSTAGRTTPPSNSSSKSGKKKSEINTKSLLKPILPLPSYDVDESDDDAVSPEGCAPAPGGSGDRRHISYLGIEDSVFPSEDAAQVPDLDEEADSYVAEEIKVEFVITDFDFGKIEKTKNGGGKVQIRGTRRRRGRRTAGKKQSNYTIL